MSKNKIMTMRNEDGEEVCVVVEGGCWYQDKHYAVLKLTDSGDRLVVRMEKDGEHEIFIALEDPAVEEAVLRRFEDALELVPVSEGTDDGSMYYNERSGLRQLGGWVRVVLPGVALMLFMVVGGFFSTKAYWGDIIWFAVCLMVSVCSFAQFMRPALNTGALREVFLGMVAFDVLMLPAAMADAPWVTAGCVAALALCVLAAWLMRGRLPEFLEKHPRLKMYMQVQRDVEQTRRNKPVSMLNIAMRRFAAAAAAVLLLIPLVGAAVPYLKVPEQEQEYVYEEEPELYTDQLMRMWQTMPAEEKIAIMQEMADYETAYLGIEPVQMIAGESDAHGQVDVEMRTMQVATERLKELSSGMRLVLEGVRFAYQADCVEAVTADGSVIPDAPYYWMARQWAAEQDEVGMARIVDMEQYMLLRMPWYVEQMDAMPLMQE